MAIHCSLRCRGIAVLAILVVAGCAERVLIRSVPPGARVIVNGEAIGETPVVFSTHEIGTKEFRYQVDRGGLSPVTGTLQTKRCTGRIVGTIFTFGILRMFKDFLCFSPEIIDVDLMPRGPAVIRVGVLRLFDLKGATVLEGQCDRGTKCWVKMPTGERCEGQYLRESRGTTTVTSGEANLQGFGAGRVVGGSINAATTGTEVSNSLSGIAVLQCSDNIIDCSLTLEAFAVQGYGQCKDSKGREYRATLVTETRAVQAK